MNFKNAQMKTGVFVVIVLFILAYATLKISKTSLFPGSTYPIYLMVESASGITDKTPVQIAGIQIGSVTGISLVDNNKAKLELSIQKAVKLSSDVQARIKATGFLGDTYIELYQPGPIAEPLAKGNTIVASSMGGDISSLTNQLSEIAVDVKQITATMRLMMAGEDSAFARSLRNIEQITESLKNVSVNNEANLNALIANLREVAVNMNTLVARNTPQVNATLDNISVITDKIKNGQGTIGRLVNDDSTVEKLNSSIDSLNDLLGGAKRMQLDVGYHGEYLGVSGDIKHYVSLAVKPRPDKYFLFELVNDPSPPSSTMIKNTKVTAGGVTSNVREEIETTSKDKFRFSAELAKKYYGFTFRGGLIESSGGFGIDYDYGPVGLKFSAFNFKTEENQAPHLKAYAQLNMTKSFYLMAGLDDFISKQHDPDWFMGAGLQMTDDDIKSILGVMNLKP